MYYGIMNIGRAKGDSWCLETCGWFSMSVVWVFEGLQAQGESEFSVLDMGSSLNTLGSP